MKTKNKELKNDGDPLANELVAHLENNGFNCGPMSPVEAQFRRGARIDKLHEEIDQLYAELRRQQ